MFRYTIKRLINNSNIIINNSCKNRKVLKILGIETSCDDTSVAIINSNGEILAESTKPQWHLHKEHRGIVPTIASDAHQKSIDFVVEDVLNKSSLEMKDIDFIAVTTGPGLSKPLKVGSEKAKSLAKEFNKPIYSVNHLEGHSLVVRMENQFGPEFPFFILLVSGGHSQILICKGVGDYQLIGNTLDESIGEVLDKGARSLGCEFGEVFDGEKIITNIHGGQAIEILAKKGDPNSHRLPLPLLNSKNCDFSFSGLRSSFDRTINKLKLNYNNSDEGLNSNNSINNNNSNSNNNKDKLNIVQINNQLNNNQHFENIKLNFKDQCDLAASFQNATFSHLEHRINRALKWYYGLPEKKKNIDLSKIVPQGPALNGLVVSGGVSKNTELRKRLTNISNQFNLPIYFPKPSLCTDNGVMIAWAGLEMHYNGNSPTNPDEIFNLPVWPLDKNPQPLFKDVNLDEKDILLRKRWYLDILERYGKNNCDNNNNNNINKKE